MTTVAYQFGSKAKYRITLELECFEDFNPHQLNWEKMLELEGSENVSAYTEDLTRPDQWQSSGLVPLIKVSLTPVDRGFFVCKNVITDIDSCFSSDLISKEPVKQWQRMSRAQC